MNIVLKIIIFDAEHGSCAFIKTPSGHGVMIDCGRKGSFSPVKYLLDHEAHNLTWYIGHALTKLIVSHPHDDHIEDINNVKQYLSPGILFRQHYDWESIKIDQRGDYANLDTYAQWQTTYNQPITNLPLLGADLLYNIYLSPTDAKRINESKFINRVHLDL